MDSNGWSEYKREILSRMDRYEKKLDELTEKLDTFAISTAMLKTEIKVKTSLFGILGGAIPTLLGIILYLVFRR